MELNWLSDVLDKINGLVWGWPMVVLLFGTHLFLTYKTRFIQKYIGKAIKISFERSREGEGDVSQFGALTTALAATVGTGNIIGVATAIAAGGPGAVLWTWLTGVFGIATKYSEALLSVRFRIKTPEGGMAGGPMYVLERGLGLPSLGILFAAFTAIAAFGIGNMVQANSIADIFYKTFEIPPFVSGIVMTILTALVILGGIKSIAKVCEALVPFMAITYIIGCFSLLLIKWQSIPETIQIIITSAFSGQAIAGGFLGATVAQAMQYGIARGLFSNESGLGSAPIVAAAAQTKNPVRQALVSATGTFWDTVVICLLTGLVLVNSESWKLTDLDISKLPPQTKETVIKSEAYSRGGLIFSKLSPELKTELLINKAWSQVKILPEFFPKTLYEEAIANNAIKNGWLSISNCSPDFLQKMAKAEGWLPPSLSGPALAKNAFSEISIGQVALTLGLLTFVYSTILGWAYYGEKAIEYLFGNRIIKFYRILWVAAVMIGSVVSLKIVWSFADIANALMAIPNLIALLWLSNVIVTETDKYLWSGNLDLMSENS